MHSGKLAECGLLSEKCVICRLVYVRSGDWPGVVWTFLSVADWRRGTGDLEYVPRLDRRLGLVQSTVIVQCVLENWLGATWELETVSSGDWAQFSLDPGSV
ncbi:hypothetical protein chiPu_0026541 [Chiloscyllium punctatum]|uniref:Uncharacterized protein n=1 Tax=Chiloscyllium punctatum TaxID=137246 RepID=A0A401TJL9_CHIPU|nr:hypothetical protein [Chiloscyllium punctatum]